MLFLIKMLSLSAWSRTKRYPCPCGSRPAIAGSETGPRVTPWLGHKGAASAIISQSWRY